MGPGRLATDYVQTTGRKVEDVMSPEVHTLTEYWTLARRQGAATDSAAAPAECPGCGAPVAPGDDVCHYCGAELPGPLRGWLLDRVDQDVDWYEGPPGFVL